MLRLQHAGRIPLTHVGTLPVQLLVYLCCLTCSWESLRVRTSCSSADLFCRSSTRGAHLNRMVNVQSVTGSCSTWLKPMRSLTCWKQGSGGGGGGGIWVE
jgi:hypothetical protein